MTQDYHIHCFHSSYASDFEGVVIKETESSFYYVDPFVYCWLTQIQLKNWENFIPLKNVDKNDIRFSVKQTFHVNSWLYSYPITSSEFSNVNEICMFLNAFLTHPETDLVMRIEDCIRKTKNYLPFVTLKNIVEFMILNLRKHPDRVRFLFSSEISTYLHHR